jgi:hypothetical protein
MQILNKRDRREFTVISFEITFDGAELRSHDCHMLFYKKKIGWPSHSPP